MSAVDARSAGEAAGTAVVFLKEAALAVVGRSQLEQRLATIEKVITGFDKAIYYLDHNILALEARMDRLEGAQARPAGGSKPQAHKD
jgi:hypothetical protein